jgi:glutamate synthase (NADPH/NADH) large chain
VRPPANVRNASDNALIGNTVLYGATSGRLFAAGKAGERFCVRNSGATAVVEGCGANGCEYMTGGVVAILGAVGANFGAGMTGGMAFVHDPGGAFESRVNPDSVVVVPVAAGYWNDVLLALVEEHARETGSSLAAEMLRNWDHYRPGFRQVCPKEMLGRLAAPLEAAVA